jgi:hypothetical protein
MAKISMNGENVLFKFKYGNRNDEMMKSASSTFRPKKCFHAILFCSLFFPFSPVRLRWEKREKMKRCFHAETGTWRKHKRKWLCTFRLMHNTQHTT